jgi:NAD(P)-dependent dehydrogenase (short-subunit alcohol dehydrogenase family)
VILEGKVILVTGAGRGIGEGTARVLAAEGAAVCVTDVDGALAERVADGITAAGGRATAHPCDVRHDDAVAAAVDHAVRTFGQLDGVDHNAAWTSFRRDTTAAEVDLATWAEVLDVNATGGLRLAQAALPHLRATRGAFVFISSGSASIGEHARVSYGVSKAAVEQLSRHLATREGRHGVRSNCVAPGFIWTDTAAAAIDEDARAILAAQNPLGRLGDPTDIANAVAFLLSDRAAFITGQVLRVDGGLLVAPRLSSS